MRNMFVICCITFGLGSCKKSVSCVDPSKIDTSINCGIIYDPVCGCDDFTYFNPCDAQRSGVRSWIGGPCLL